MTLDEISLVLSVPLIFEVLALGLSKWSSSGKIVTFCTKYLYLTLVALIPHSKYSQIFK